MDLFRLPTFPMDRRGSGTYPGVEKKTLPSIFTPPVRFDDDMIPRGVLFSAPAFKELADQKYPAAIKREVSGVDHRPFFRMMC